MVSKKLEKEAEFLSQISSPIPQFFKDVMSLYGVDLPLYLVPQAIIWQFTDEDAVGHFWVDKTVLPHKPLGILIANDEWQVKYKNPHLARLKALLHEIGHYLFHEEAMKFFATLQRRRPSTASWYAKMGIENRIEKWVKDQWRELKRYVNAKRNNWKKGMSFKQIREEFKYDHDRYRTLFQI